MWLARTHLLMPASQHQLKEQILKLLEGWSPGTNDRSDDHLQVDLWYEFLICAVATQGRSTSDDWTTEYKLQLSLDGSTFVVYKENNVDKVG